MTDPHGPTPPEPDNPHRRLVWVGDLAGLTVAAGMSIGLLLWMVGGLPWMRPGLPPVARAVVDWLFDLLGIYAFYVAFLLAGVALFIVFYACLFGVTWWWNRHVR